MWWQQQFQAWQEIVWGLILLVTALYLEDLIDRKRKRGRSEGRRGVTVKIRRVKVGHSNAIQKQVADASSVRWVSRSGDAEQGRDVGA